MYNADCFRVERLEERSMFNTTTWTLAANWELDDQEDNGSNFNASVIVGGNHTFNDGLIH